MTTLPRTRMDFVLRYFLVFVLPLLGGCAVFPPDRSGLIGTHTASIGFNQSTTVTLKADGTYERSVSLFYCSPVEFETPDGKEIIDGWTNKETGMWEISDRVVVLTTGEREIENSAVEKKYFDEIRSYPITYKFPQGWLLVYPSWRCVLMKKMPVPPASRPNPPMHEERSEISGRP